MTVTILLDLYPIIQDDPVLSALIGDRFYFGELPQNSAMPALTYVREDIKYEYLETGAINVYRVELAFTAHSHSGEQAHEVIEATTTIFDGFKGDIGTATVIRGIIKGGGQDNYENTLDLYHIPANVEFWYVPNVPQEADQP